MLLKFKSEDEVYIKREAPKTFNYFTGMTDILEGLRQLQTDHTSLKIRKIRYSSVHGEYAELYNGAFVFTDDLTEK